LSIEFQQFNLNNILIEGEFDPKTELAKVKSSSWDSKPLELAKYKEKFITQKLAIAECRIYLERLIRHNPDIDRIYLEKTIKNFKEKYGFSYNQLQIFNDLLDIFYEKRKELKYFRERFPNNIDLIKFITGVELDPKDEVVIEIDPLNFYIRASSDVMYKINSGVKILSDSKNFWKNKGSLGYFTNYSQELDGRNYKISVIFLPSEKEANSEEFLLGENMESILIHERYHVTNDLILSYFKFKDSIYFNKNENFRFEDLRNKNQIDNFLDIGYSRILARTQDEFIAQVIGKTGDERVFLTDFENKFSTAIKYFLYQMLSGYTSGYGAYNYLSYYSNIPKFGDLRDDIWKTKIHSMKNKYKNDLERSTKSFWRLVHEGEFTVNQSVALLTDRFILDWPLEVSRILELQRESKN